LADEVELRHHTRHGLRSGPDGLTWKYDPAVDSVLSSGGDGGAALLWRMWSQIRAPTLVVRGAYSDLLSPDTARLMVARGHDVRLVEVPDAGHGVPVDNPRAFRRAVTDFLG
jgi:pimeloyl-ACP methyl ester carboxylesterase